MPKMHHHRSAAQGQQDVNQAITKRWCGEACDCFTLVKCHVLLLLFQKALGLSRVPCPSNRLVVFMPQLILWSFQNQFLLKL